jgi:hypothetical protein
VTRTRGGSRLTPEEEDAWVEDFQMRYGSDLLLEGRYDAYDLGRSPAAMVPQDAGVVDYMRYWGPYFDWMMPKAGQVAPVPEDPDQMPTRAHALARRLRRG